MGVIVFLGQGTIAIRLLECREVLSLQVLDERNLEGLLIVDGKLDARDLGQTDGHSRVKSALTRNQLVLSSVDSAHEQGFENPVSVD